MHPFRVRLTEPYVTPVRWPEDAREDAASVLLGTLRPLQTGLFELGELHGLAFGFADAAVEGVVHDQGADLRVLGAAEGVEDERLAPGMLPADAAAAEAAGAEGRPFAGPAVHLLILG